MRAIMVLVLLGGLGVAGYALLQVPEVRDEVEQHVDLAAIEEAIDLEAVRLAIRGEVRDVAGADDPPPKMKPIYDALFGFGILIPGRERGRYTLEDVDGRLLLARENRGQIEIAIPEGYQLDPEMPMYRGNVIGMRLWRGEPDPDWQDPVPPVIALISEYRGAPARTFRDNREIMGKVAAIVQQTGRPSGFPKLRATNARAQASGIYFCVEAAESTEPAVAFTFLQERYLLTLILRPGCDPLTEADYEELEALRRLLRPV
ncbi:MAG: hypothetical protein ACFBSD_11710 [Paracoccaceae bacterium]